MKPTLIISFTFPPSAGIGGRRWAKFAKYLFRKGVDVTILAGKNQYPSTSEWVKDIEEYKDRVIFSETNYPKYLGIIPKTFFEKIAYRIALLKSKFLVKGNYYDKSANWNKSLLKEAEQIIRSKKIKNLIVTCAPFRTAYDLCILKEKYPHLNFIVDFRDPWTTNRTAYGFEHLSNKRKEYEQIAEKKVINNASLVICVAEDMTNYFKSICTNNTTQFHTIANGFDKDDFSVDTVFQKEDNKLRFVFAGTLYDKALHQFSVLINALNEIRKEAPDIYNNMEFNFIGTVPQHFFELKKQHPFIYHIHHIPLIKVYEKIAKADVCLLFITDDLTYSFSTKFYEYLSHHKPIVVFSNQGKMPEHIVSNKLGYHISKENCSAGLLKIYSDSLTRNLITNKNYDINAYDVKNITNQIYNLLLD